MKVKPGKYSIEEIEAILAADFGPKCKPNNGPLTEANRRRCQKIAANEERREYGCLY